MKFYGNDTFVKGPEVEDKETGLKLKVMHSMNAIAEKLFQAHMGRKRIVTEHLKARKLGQKGWSLNPLFVNSMHPGHVVFFAEVDETTGKGELLGWAPWEVVETWPSFSYGSIGSVIATAPKNAIQNLSTYQEAI